METATHILRVDDLAYGTPEGRVLQCGVQFAMESGQILLITGDNGCGKSTLLRVLMGHWRPVAGEVSALPSYQYLPQLENQQAHLPLTLGDVVELGGGAIEGARQWGLLPYGFWERGWNTASGGERKRALLARALVADPDLLILDEPFNHLDSISRDRMVRALERFVTERPNRGVLIVSHGDALVDWAHQRVHLEGRVE